MQWSINARHSRENLEGDNGYACTACAASSGVNIKSREALRDAVKQVCVQKAPLILVVIVQRFIDPVVSKLREIVPSTDAVEYGGQRYRLRAEIRHVGHTPNSGHCTAVLKKGGRMVVFDDEDVIPVLPGTVIRGDVYLLWYARETTSF